MRDLCGNIADLMATLNTPTYSEASGRALAEAHGDTITKMMDTVGLLKGLRLGLEKELEQWHEKLTELEAVSESVGNA